MWYAIVEVRYGDEIALRTTAMKDTEAQAEDWARKSLAHYTAQHKRRKNRSVLAYYHPDCCLPGDIRHIAEVAL